MADGIVTYLNGTEVYRFTMASGPVNAFVPAASSIDFAFESDPLALTLSTLQVGTNVFAAELHGFNSNDNSVVFGAELNARILSWARGPVLITSGPDDVTVCEGDAAEFTFVGVGASEIQWQTNGVVVIGGTQPVLDFKAVPLSWDGLVVSVIASNSSSVATSMNARLHVIRDTIPPLLLSAMAQTNGILLTFNEPVLPSSATNLANYRLTNASGSTLSFSDASLPTPSTVLLSGPALPSDDYRVVVDGVRDTSAAQNEMAPNTSATIGFDLFIPFDSVWQFFTNNVDLGTRWRSLDYTDTSAPWSSGPGVIADETALLQEPIRTPISRLDNGVYHYTFYFRHHFTAPSGVQVGSLTLRHIIDDGAVFYLNGTEFHRFNMAAGAVDYMTQTLTNVGDAVYSGPYTIAVSNLVAGDNVIAVEVHQNGTTSSDVTFGAELSLDVPSIVCPGIASPSLRIVRIAGEVAILWTGSGFTLEQTDLLGTNAVWTTAPNQNSPFLPTFDAATQRFYRLQK